MGIMGPGGERTADDSQLVEPETARLTRELNAKLPPDVRALAFTPDQLASLLAWHRQCGPHCVGDEHREASLLTFVYDDDAAPTTWRDLVPQLELVFAEEYGVTFLRAERAPGLDDPEWRAKQHYGVAALSRESLDVAYMGDLPAEALEHPNGRCEGHWIYFALPVSMEAIKTALLPHVLRRLLEER